VPGEERLARPGAAALSFTDSNRVTEAIQRPRDADGTPMSWTK